MGRKALSVTALAAAAMMLPNLGAAQQRGDPDHDACREQRWRGDDRERYCEVREFTIGARRSVIVDGGPNGGIEVVGWDRNEIHVRAKIQTWGRRLGDAEDVAQDIEVITDERTIRADGPRWRGRNRDQRGWSVSFEVMVPRNSDLSLEATNGGISIEDVSGTHDFRTTNGGLSLAGVSGDVRGRTTNGGVRVELDGIEWQGTGLDVESTNGGVTMWIPSDYRCDLEVGTVNGGFQIDFPIVIQGRINRRRIRTELNGGGPLIRAVTTNGGVTVRQR